MTDIIWYPFFLIAAVVAMYFLAMASKHKKLLEQRQTCKHKFELYRICKECGLRQRGIKDD